MHCVPWLELTTTIDHGIQKPEHFIGLLLCRDVSPYSYLWIQ